MMEANRLRDEAFADVSTADILSFLGRDDADAGAFPGVDQSRMFRAGVVVVDKPQGPTSHQVSAWVRDMFRVTRAGHSGTLDPRVTGLDRPGGCPRIVVPRSPAQPQCVPHESQTAMHFEIIGEITTVRVIAAGRSVRVRKHLDLRFGRGRWRKMKGEATA